MVGRKQLSSVGVKSSLSIAIAHFFVKSTSFSENEFEFHQTFFFRPVHFYAQLLGMFAFINEFILQIAKTFNLTKQLATTI